MDEGKYFVVSAAHAEVACSLGLGPGLSYLVLAAFTDASNTITNAGVHAVERYAGLTRSRAAECIQLLCEKGLVRRVSEGKRPTYELIGFDENESVWLPVVLVTGPRNGCSPLEKVRETHDPLVLRLLLDVYRHLDFSVGGVTIDAIRSEYKRAEGEGWPQSFRGGDSKLWRLWAFKAHTTSCFVNHPFVRPHLVAKAKEKSCEQLWTRLRRLQDAGLVSYVRTLFDDEGPDGAVTYSLRSDGPHTANEWLLWSAAGSLAGELGYEAGDWTFLPLLDEPRFQRPMLRGVLRPKYLAATTPTLAWRSDLSRTAKQWTETMELATGAALISKADNTAAKTA